MKCILLTLLFISNFVASLAAQEIPLERLDVLDERCGFASQTEGGKQLYLVTSLADSGPGSLREAISVSDRWIIFDPVVFNTKPIVLASPLILLSDTTIDGRGATVRITNVPGTELKLFDINNTKNIFIIKVHLDKAVSLATQGGDSISIRGPLSDQIWLRGILFTGGGDEGLGLGGSGNITADQCEWYGMYHPISAGHVNEPNARLTLYRCRIYGCNSRMPQVYCFVHQSCCIIEGWVGNGSRARGTGKIFSENCTYIWSSGSLLGLWYSEDGAVRSKNDQAIIATIQENRPEDVILPPDYVHPNLYTPIGPSSSVTWPRKNILKKRGWK